jgi:hypothetical protein
MGAKRRVGDEPPEKAGSLAENMGWDFAIHKKRINNKIRRCPSYGFGKEGTSGTVYLVLRTEAEKLR